MKNYYIIIFICFIINCQKYNQRIETIYDKIIDNISFKINEILEEIKNKKVIEGKSECLNKMDKSYNGENKYGYLTKLFYDSSPNYEDIKKYYNCYYKLYQNVNQDILNKTTYVVIKYTQKQENSDTEFEQCFNKFSKIFGACLPQGCSDDEYLKIINYTNNKYSLIEGDITEAINLKPEYNFSIKNAIVPFLIPALMLIFILSIIGIQYVSSPFWSVFGFFYYLCNKRKYAEENIKTILKRNKFSQIDTLNSFVALSLNVEEVMPGSKESHINDENGLHMVVGLRGIFIIGLFFGITLQNIFITPTRIFDDEQYLKYMDLKLYSVLLFFARISQKMLYALSGFELTFKLLFYFDNQLYKQYIFNSHSTDNSSMNKSSDKSKEKKNNNNSLSFENKSKKSEEIDKIKTSLKSKERT